MPGEFFISPAAARTLPSGKIRLIANQARDAGLVRRASTSRRLRGNEERCFCATEHFHKPKLVIAGIRERDSNPDALEHFVHEYLTRSHRDNREEGCPSAALLDEMGRCDDTTRRAYTASLLELVDEIAAAAGVDPKEERTKLLGVYALLVGTLQLSRDVIKTPRQAGDTNVERRS